MGRPLRENITGATYHVYSRCINKEDLMKSNKIKDLMIQVIKETQEKYEFDLNAFEILDNHFHFLIKIINNTYTISKILQRIKSIFAKRFNKIYNRCGPFWNERFGSSIIEKSNYPAFYLLYLIWYMAYNSVRKAMVDNPRKYKYSSINCYLSQNYNSQLKVTLHKYFLNLSEIFHNRISAFLDYEILYLKTHNLI